MNFKNKDIINYLDEIDKHLKTSDKIRFEYNLFWSRQFKDAPAVYAFFKKEELIYIGETASLKKRMSDIRRTYNHTFRKQIGVKKFKAMTNTKGVFSDDIEEALNNYFEEHISMNYCYMNFGRSEAESYLIHKNKGENADLLFNKIGERDLNVIEALKS